MTITIDLCDRISAVADIRQERGEYPTIDESSFAVYLYVADVKGFISDGYDITHKLSYSDRKSIEQYLIEKYQSQTLDFDEGDAAYDFAKDEGLL